MSRHHTVRAAAFHPAPGGSQVSSTATRTQSTAAEIGRVEERVCGTGAAEAMATTVADIAAVIQIRAGVGLAASRSAAVECLDAFAAVELGAANAAKPDGSTRL